MKVVCGIISNGGKLFIARRREGKSLSGYWEFPGGKINEGESEREALTRELVEELNMEVEIVERIGAFPHHYEDFSIILIGFKCKLIKWKGMMTDHDKAEWMLLNELVKYDFAPADLPIIEKLLKAQ
jgi:8-oxo-dGTP diphosphatase